MVQETTIIPVAGGKGGVGKSFVTANLAVALARRGHPTVAVDLDLGNSNLHSFLGLENRYAGIGEYLRGAVRCEPAELIVKTDVPGLGFVPGDGRMPFMANITHAQKQKLTRAVRQLPARYVLLDLSAGTTFNTLDLFLTADSGLLVTTPEHPALMNMFTFVKNLVLRALEQALKGVPSAAEKLAGFYRQSVNDPVFTVEQFRRELAQSNPEAEAVVRQVCRRVRPRLVYNMVESFQETEIFARVDRTLAESVSIECDHFGVIPFDASVRQSLKRPSNFLAQSPSSQTAEMLERIAHRVVNYWHTPVEGSAQLLAERSRDVLPDARGRRA